MSLIKPQKVEELIVKRLKNGPVLTLDLVQKIKQDRPNTTKQAVYAAVRKMKAEEMILTVKGASSLNMTWINEMITYLDLAKRHYVNKGSQGSILDMEDGERIKYYFTDSHRGDIFWTHAYFLLLENLASDEPVFLYNPHEWFLLAREENERSVIRSTVSAGHLFLLTACGVPRQAYPETVRWDRQPVQPSQAAIVSGYQLLSQYIRGLSYRGVA